MFIFLSRVILIFFVQIGSKMYISLTEMSFFYIVWKDLMLRAVNDLV